MRQRRELAPHEKVFYRERIGRLRFGETGDDCCFPSVQSVMLGAIIMGVIVACGSALAP